MYKFCVFVSNTDCWDGLVYVLASIACISQLVVADDDCSQYGVLPGKSSRGIYEKNSKILVMTDRPSFVYCNMTLVCGGERLDKSMLPRKIAPIIGWKKITSPVAACRPPSDVSQLIFLLIVFHTVEYVE